MSASTSQISAAAGRRAELTENFVAQLKALRRLTSRPTADRGDDGPTLYQLEVLAQLAGNPDGMTMNEVARCQGCAPGTATALVERLIKQGLADRFDDPSDRRIVRIRATPAAGSLVREAQVHKRELAERVLAPLGDDELAQLVALITKVVDSMERHHG